jgi:hypothetical protein
MAYEMLEQFLAADNSRAVEEPQSRFSTNQNITGTTSSKRMD